MVRKELGQHKEDTGQENFQLHYNILLVDLIEGDGFNPAGILYGAIPRPVHVERAATKAGQVPELLSSCGKAFAASRQWNHCEFRLGNAQMTLQASQQQQQRQMNEEGARVKVAERKVR